MCPLASWDVGSRLTDTFHCLTIDIGRRMLFHIGQRMLGNVSCANIRHWQQLGRTRLCPEANGQNKAIKETDGA